MPAPIESSAVEWSSAAATLAIGAAVASALALLALHWLSREFDPSWRMVSEYALGKYAWLLTVVLVTWGVSFWALAGALSPLWVTWLGRLGLVFLALAGLGAMMGGVFDVNHKLHAAAFAIGVPSLTIAAILVTLAVRMAGVEVSMWPAHLSWISVVLMVIAMALYFNALSRVGIDPSKMTAGSKQLPDGVIAYHGWANRLLFAASYLWLIYTASAVRP